MSLTTTKRHRLPNEIINDWDTTLDQATTLSEGQRNLVRASISYALPPLSRSDVLQALQFYLNDQNVPTTWSVETLVEQLPVQAEQRRYIATSHPLYLAMTKITGSHTLHHSFRKACRRMMSTYFARVSQDAHPQTLYTDVVQTRDVLSKIANQDDNQPEEGEAEDHFLMGRINWYLANAASVPQNWRDKAGRFQRLFRGMNRIVGDGTACKPGVRQQNRAAQRRRRRGGQRDDALDKEMQESVRKRAARHQQPTSRPSMDRQDQQEGTRSSSEYSGLVEQGPYRQVPSARASNHGGEADEQEDLLQRTTPSTMSVDDDRHVVQYAQRMSLVDTLTSMTDIHRLTTGQLIEALTSCRHDPAQWALSILLLCTGMPLERLQSLTVDTTPTWEKSADADAPQVVADNTLLTYCLLDGPSSTPMSHDHRWVTLALPDVLIQAMRQAVVEQGRQPFRRTAKTLKRHWTPMSRRTAGLPPTPNRLAATSWMLKRPAAQDDVAARALSGRFGMALSAPAAYRALAPGELDALFHKVVSYLLPSLSPRPSWLTGPPVAWADTPNPRAANWQTGSPHAVPVAEFRPWFQWLQKGMGRAARQFINPLNPRERSPQALLEVIAISAAHSYLLMLLTTGCRPHGTRVRCERVGDYLWLADKNSPRALESRWIPAAKELQASLDAHQRLVADATGWLERQGYTVNEHRLAGEFSLCAEINETRRTQMAVAPITHRRFIQQLTTLQPSDAEPRLVPDDAVRNITRHSMATYCRGLLSETQLAALLGHVSGFRQQGPGSAAAGPARSAWQTVISDLLKEAGHQTLTRSSLQHALRH